VIVLTFLASLTNRLGDSVFQQIGNTTITWIVIAVVSVSHIFSCCWCIKKEVNQRVRANELNRRKRREWNERWAEEADKHSA